MNDLIARLLAHERIRAARRHVERADELTLARQAALSATPAPTGAEAARGARVAELFREVGLTDVGLDHAGNVRGWYARNREGPAVGAQHAAPLPAPVVLAAHLDTVFGPEVDVRVTRHGQRLEGPGISDNARGLAALVAVAEALVATGVTTARPILFAATVGEEGSGDLRGVKYLLNGRHDVGAQHAAPLPNAAPLPVAFIALDGAGLERVIHRALGSKRYHVTFRGPGGHSWAAFGVANPANAVGRAAALLADLPIATAPRTTCAVVGLGGGTGLNSIPQDAWLDLDLRSEDPRALAQLDVTVRAALERAADDENRSRSAGTPPLRVEVQLVGDRRCERANRPRHPGDRSGGRGQGRRCSPHDRVVRERRRSARHRPSAPRHRRDGGGRLGPGRRRPQGPRHRERLAAVAHDAQLRRVHVAHHTVPVDHVRHPAG